MLGNLTSSQERSSAGNRAIFADPDGGYQARVYDPARGDVRLDPFDPDSTK